MLTSLHQRILSAIVLFIIFATVLYLGDFWFSLFLSIILGCAIGEWVSMVGNRRPILGFWSRLALNIAGSLFLLATIVSLFYLNSSQPDWQGGIGFAESGLASLLWIFCQIWATDIAAFFVGRRLGGAKLAPRISPNKTWSGAIGGTVASLLVSIAFVGIFIGWSVLPLFYAGLVGLVVSVLAQMGDLLESAMKRYFQVKDSGRLIPGHGGVLDRIDGFLLVMPLVALASYWHRGPLLAWLDGR